MHSTIQHLKKALQPSYDIAHAIATLNWDQLTYMPALGSEARARAMATQQRLYHEAIVHESVIEALESAEMVMSELNADEQRIVTLTRKELDKKIKIPKEFVEERAFLQAQGYDFWLRAKNENKPELFLPILEKIVASSQKYASYLQPKATLYDALLDEYEEGITQAELDPLFDDLRDFLVPFAKKVSQTKHSAILAQEFDINKQAIIGNQMIADMGFDMKKGRLDTTVHPFCSGISLHDVRLATAFTPHELMRSISSSVHETGHGLYDQNLPPEFEGTPLAGAVSTGFHETQSRIWEVLVGLSLPYWKYYFPKLQELFPDQLGKYTVEEFYAAVNTVTPTLIRTESDEVHYNLHIIIRYELEKQLINGTLSVYDLESAWNDHYYEYLGITPKTPSEGFLQDVHWSDGSFGYFPTYTLGNLGAAQLYVQAQQDIPNLAQNFEKGLFLPLTKWLATNIHQQGARYTTNELLTRVTGKVLGIDDFKSYLQKKYPI